MANERDKRIEELKAQYPDEIGRLDYLLHRSPDRKANKEEVKNIVLAVMNDSSDSGVEKTAALIEYYDLVTNNTTLYDSEWMDESVFDHLTIGINEMKKSLAEALKQKAANEADIAALNKRIEELNEKNAELESKVDSGYAERARKNAVEQARSWKRRFDAVGGLAVEKKVKALIAEKEALTEKYNALESEHAELEKKHGELEGEYTTAQAENAELKTRNEESDKSTAAAVEQAENAQKRAKTLGIVVAALATTTVVFGAAAAIHAAIIFNTKEAGINIKAELEAYKKEIADLKGQIAAKDAEIADLNAKIAKLEAEKAQLEGEKAQLEADKEANEAEIVNLNEQIAAKDAEIANFNEQIAAKDAEIANLNNEIITKTNEFNEVIAKYEESLEKLEKVAEDNANWTYTTAGLDWNDVAVENIDGKEFVVTFDEPAEMTELGSAHYAAAQNSNDPVYVQWADFTLDGNAVMLSGTQKLVEEAMNQSTNNQAEEGKADENGATGVSDNNTGAGTQIGGGAGSQTDPEPEVEVEDNQGQEDEETNNTAAGELVEFNQARFNQVNADLLAFISDLDAGNFICTTYSEAEVRAECQVLTVKLASVEDAQDAAEKNRIVEEVAEQLEVVKTWVSAYQHF